MFLYLVSFVLLGFVACSSATLILITIEYALYECITRCHACISGQMLLLICDCCAKCCCEHSYACPLGVRAHISAEHQLGERYWAMHTVCLFDCFDCTQIVIKVVWVSCHCTTSLSTCGTV